MSRGDEAIRRCWQEWVDSGRFKHHDVSGRPRTISDREDRFIVRSAVTASYSSLSNIRRATRTQESTMTIHRWLVELNLRSYRTLRHMPLTLAHYQAICVIKKLSQAPLSQWCLAQSGWNHAEWGCIVLSCEIRFQLCSDDHRRRVWRRPGQRTNPTFTIARHTYPQPGVMVCGATSFDSKTPLVVIRGSLTAQLFIDDILRTVLLPFLLQYPGLIFQQDNIKPHTVRVARNSVANTFFARKIAISLSNQACLGLD
ncbi:transposable element Tcb2 transposase [Trichonephila clavipes]|nr:transposable element Tcb2 transposase [Trichonephila clavipes]